MPTIEVKLCVENDQEIPAIQILPSGDATPAGYTDQTMDLLKWKDFGEPVCTDYLQFRMYIMQVMTDKVDGGDSWDDLSDAEKDLLIENYASEDQVDGATDGMRKVVHLMTVHGMSQPEAVKYLEDVFADHHIKEIDSCEKRVKNKTLFQVIAKYLTIAEAADFTQVIDQPYYMYATQGIKGINDGEAGEGLFDFIESTAGTSYETAGLQEQGYPMKNGDPDMTNFIADLMEVLRKGNYEL